MPYLLFLKKQQDLKVPTAANYRWRDYGPTCASWAGNFSKKYDLGVKKNRPDKRVLLSILT